MEVIKHDKLYGGYLYYAEDMHNNYNFYKIYVYFDVYDQYSTWLTGYVTLTLNTFYKVRKSRIYESKTLQVKIEKYRAPVVFKLCVDLL